MTLASHALPSTEPLMALRQLRARQAWTLFVVALFSIGIGLSGVTLGFGTDGRAAAGQAFAWQFLIWGAIDMVFAAMGIAQSTRAARTPPTPQAEADEFLAAEKLLGTLRFNHYLNIAYVGIAVGLLIWAVLAHSPALAGHGVGVLVQGGFLLVFDFIYARRFDCLMSAPVD